MAKHHVEHHGSKHVEHHHYKKGGKAMKKGGHVEGHKGHHKMASGGKVMGGAKMTPSSPMSGAGKMKDRPGLKAASTDSKND